MITADQLFLHGLGDYVLQSDWMATEKTKRWRPAAAHALVYSLPFLALSPTPSAWLVILGTHYLIDRYRLARYVVWAKNFIAPRSYTFPWSDCDGTGYPKDRPAWLAVWLMIFADNLIHIAINGLALRYL
jgi:hypothetical protein